ncbi:MAG TPA: hypothetical protein VKR38_08575, partial [Usitatibacter sp.]|nr:hypothetical protein [Usitatibacter sp.]
PPLGYVLFPAMQISAALANGIQNSTAVDFAIGVAVELMAAWLLLRVAKWAIRPKSDGDAAQ